MMFRLSSTLFLTQMIICNHSHNLHISYIPLCSTSPHPFVGTPSPPLHYVYLLHVSIIHKVGSFCSHLWFPHHFIYFNNHYIWLYANSIKYTSITSLPLSWSSLILYQLCMPFHPLSDVDKIFRPCPSSTWLSHWPSWSIWILHP